MDKEIFHLAYQISQEMRHGAQLMFATPEDCLG